MPGPGIEPLTGGMPSGRANHYTTAQLVMSTICLECLFMRIKDQDKMETQQAWT